MKTVEKMKKNAPKFVDDTHVQVTKAFIGSKENT